MSCALSVCLEYVAFLSALIFPDLVGSVGLYVVMVPVSLLCPLCFLPSAYSSGEAFVRYLHLDKELSDPGECVHVCVHGIYVLCLCVCAYT